jgi:hypothetical protein
MKTNDGKVIAIKKVVAIKTVYGKFYKNDCSPPFSFITIQDFLVLLMHSFFVTKSMYYLIFQPKSPNILTGLGRIYAVFF